MFSDIGYYSFSKMANDIIKYEFANRNRDVVRKRPRNVNRTGGYSYKLQPKKYPDAERNKPCPCGSGLKFKRCCIDVYVEIENAEN